MRYCVHHLNDFSGSPLILRERMDSMAVHGAVTLVTNHGTGFLSDWAGPVVRFNYTKHDNAILRFVSLSLWYINVGLYLARALKPSDALILSTLISSPLLLVRYLRRSIEAEVFVNEVLFRVPIWRWIGLKAMRSRSVKKIYLSQFVQDSWRFSGPSRVVYPSIRKPLVELALTRKNQTIAEPNRLRFFLVCSQIDAKGYRLFIEIASHYDQQGLDHAFALYLSGSKERFASDYPPDTLPTNLSVFFNETSPEIFFGHDIFLGLTNPSEWTETFGQTFAEAMIAGNITVVPPVGAQLEYLHDKENGFVFTEYSLQGILAQIELIQSLPDLSVVKEHSRTSMLAFLGAQKPYQVESVHPMLECG